MWMCMCSGSVYVTQQVTSASYSAQPASAIWRLNAWPLQKQIMQLIQGDSRDYDRALRFTVDLDFHFSYLFTVYTVFIIIYCTNCSYTLCIVYCTYCTCVLFL